MGISQKTQPPLFLINIHYGIYEIIKSDLFRYPIKTVDSKSGASEKRGVQVGNKRKKNRQFINK